MEELNKVQRIQQHFIFWSGFKVEGKDIQETIIEIVARKSKTLATLKSLVGEFSNGKKKEEDVAKRTRSSKRNIVSEEVDINMDRIDSTLD